jgi:dihydroflavonol-4-reductase
VIVAVTGASGHLGGTIVRRLIDRGGIDVRVLVHSDTRAIDGLPLEVVRGNICDPFVCERIADGASKIIHCAASIATTNRNRRNTYETNLKGTKNIIRACLHQKKTRLVHVSSIHTIASSPAKGITDESTPLIVRGGYAYERSKATAERAVLEAVREGLDAVVCSPTGIIGPYDFKPSLTGDMLIALVTQRFVALVDAGFDWVDVRDAADGIVAAMEFGKTGERYILSGKWHTLSEIASILEKISGCRVPQLIVPMWIAAVAAPFVSAFSMLTGNRPLFTPGSLVALRQHRYISSEKTRASLGYSPRPLFETITETYEWFVNAGMIVR